MKPVVLQLIDSFNQGGSERQAIQLTRLLHLSGRFSVRLASLNGEGLLRADAETIGLGDIPSFPLNSFYDRNALVQLRRLNRFLVRSGVQILHTHDFYTNIFGMTAGSFARVPLRIASMRETDGMRSGAQKGAQRFAYGLAHHVVANSEAVARKLIAEGVSSNKVTVVYNGVDVQRFSCEMPRPDALSLLDLAVEIDNSPRRFVTIVANMRHEVKDYPMFLRAARLVHQAEPTATFLLAGEGELMESLQSLAEELGIAANTLFLGRCNRVAELLSVSDVCVLSSKNEGFSNSILEYMAAGRPVVATNVGGAEEAVVEGQTGFLVPSGDDEMMARRIVSLLRDPGHARATGERGKRLVEERFSCDAQLKRTQELYDRLLVPVRAPEREKLREA